MLGKFLELSGVGGRKLLGPMELGAGWRLAVELNAVLMNHRP